jgi:RecJ-like exonuclease
MTEEGLAKISARTIDTITGKGVNLAEALRIAAEKYAGKGGGHNIAAGAQVPIHDLEPFLKLVDDLVKKQLEGATVGSQNRA